MHHVYAIFYAACRRPPTHPREKHNTHVTSVFMSTLIKERQRKLTKYTLATKVCTLIAVEISSHNLENVKGIEPKLVFYSFL